jgi:hypothetical protein
MSLSFSLHESACRANVKEHMCHIFFKECAEVDGFFLPALTWYSMKIVGFYENENRPFSFFIAFCFCFWQSRSECEKRKAIWDACVLETNEDPDLKEHFDTQMLSMLNLMGQFSLNKLIIAYSFCL